MELTKKQAEGLKIALERFDNHEKYTVIAGYAGTGKAQPNDTFIPMADGNFKFLGDIKVGDYVYDRKGLPTKVLGVFPQGLLKKYKVCFSDGRSTYCNDEHLWSYYDPLDSTKTLKTKTLREILNSDLPLIRYAIPIMRVAVEPKIAYEKEITLHDIEEMALLCSTALKSSEISIVPYLEEIARWSTPNKYALLMVIFKLMRTDLLHDNILKIPSLNNRQLFSTFLWGMGLYNYMQGQDYLYYNDNSFIQSCFIEKVEEFDIKVPMTCIWVDNPEHLYLTNDFIVTHNTTLVKSIVNELLNKGVKEDEVGYATYTGKAAQVLLRKGNPNVSTLHRLLYNARLDFRTGEYYFQEKQEIDYPIVVVDEVSMVPQKFVELLLKKARYVLFLGDPFQIPPISKDGDNGLLVKPHIFLDEIMRQAEDNDIIRLSMLIREGKPIPLGKGEHTMVISAKDFDPAMLLWADQVLCATNKMRMALNSAMRTMKGFEGNPKPGDKMICLKNDWDVFSEKRLDPLVNGTIGYIGDQCKEGLYVLPKNHHTAPFPILDFTLKSDDGADYYKGMRLDINEAVGGKPSYSYKSIPLMKTERFIKNQGIIPMSFTFGYAITYWKAQGSEWDKVLAYEESFPFDTETHQRALYTAVTRASDKIILSRNI